MLDQLLDLLAPGWVGSLIGLAGIAAAALTYVLSRRRTILSYRTRGVRLLGQAGSKLPDGVTVQYQGKDIPRLTRSVVVLWNDGETTISGTDLIPNDPLRIVVEDDTSVVACTLLKSTRAVLQANCTLRKDNSQEVLLNFGFLDPSDGVVVELLHTGRDLHPRVKGTVRGIPQGPKNRGRVLPKKPPSVSVPLLRSRKAFALIVVTVGCAISIAGVMTSTVSTISPPTKTVAPKYALISAGALYAGLGCLMLWMLRRRYPRSLHSEELE